MDPKCCPKASQDEAKKRERESEEKRSEQRKGLERCKGEKHDWREIAPRFLQVRWGEGGGPEGKLPPRGLEEGRFGSLVAGLRGG